MEKIDTSQIANDIEIIRKSRLVARRLKKGAYRDLEPYATEIIAYAKQPRVSKSLLKEMLIKKFGVEISGDRIYRFVVARIGVWPNQQAKKRK